MGEPTLKESLFPARPSAIPERCKSKLEEIAPAATTNVFPRTSIFLPLLNCATRDVIFGPFDFNLSTSQPAMTWKFSGPACSCACGKTWLSMESFLPHLQPILQYPQPTQCLILAATESTVCGELCNPRRLIPSTNFTPPGFMYSSLDIVFGIFNSSILRTPIISFTRLLH